MASPRYAWQTASPASQASQLPHNQPHHPYTRLLFEAVPRLGVPLRAEQVAAPTELPGNRKLPEGCFFLERCSSSSEGCSQPQVMRGGEHQRVRCHVMG